VVKLVVAGSRSITDTDLFLQAMDLCTFDFDCVIQGGAKGVDTMIKLYCAMLKIPQLEYPADWDDLTDLPEHLIGVRADGSEYNKIAGPIRNSQMANDGDALFAIWDEESTGTRDMINQMLRAGKHVQVISVKNWVVKELFDFES
jgi:hypothetical protein